MAPHAASSSCDAVLVYWIEPCHNGNETSMYHIQKRRVYTDGPEDSESDEEENDTTQWLDAAIPAVGDVIGSYRMTGAPDLLKMAGVRGKRRFGRRCSFPIDGLRSGKSYQFRIRAMNDLGWSEFGDASIPCRTIGLNPRTHTHAVVVGC